MSDPIRSAPPAPDDTILALENVSKFFGKVIALNGVTLRLKRGEVHCLLGDNGAGKSTLIKTLAGVHTPSSGEYLVDGKPVRFGSPKEALDLGIATVYQDLALVPLLSVARNFFMGREPQKHRARGSPKWVSTCGTRISLLARCRAVKSSVSPLHGQSTSARVF